MASVDASRSFSFDLPLCLLTEPKDGQIMNEGLRDIAKDLIVNIRILQEQIRQQKYLDFVSIIDVQFSNGFIYITFEISNKIQLECLYECIKTRDNQLSKWLTTYFMSKSMELVAGLELNAKITCQIWMAQSLFYKYIGHLCEIDEELLDAQKKGRGSSSVTSSEQTRSSRCVQELLQEIIQREERRSIAALSTNVTSQCPDSYANPDDYKWLLQEKSSTVRPGLEVESCQQPSTSVKYPGSYPYESTGREKKEHSSKCVQELEDRWSHATLTTNVTTNVTSQCPDSYANPDDYKWLLQEKSSTGLEVESCQEPVTSVKYPGSYPYESTRRENKEHAPMVRKLFLLYVPAIKGWIVKKIVLHFDIIPLNAEMKQHDVDIYECMADIPDIQGHLVYSYERHLKSNSVINVKDKLFGTPPEKSARYHLNKRYVQRDSWIGNGVKIHDQCSFHQEYLNAHLADLLYHCSTKFSISDACMQIENLCSRSLSKEYAVKILKNLALSLSEGTDLTMLLFVVITGRILPSRQILYQEHIIDRPTAQRILRALGNYRIKTLPVSLKDRVISVCLNLFIQIQGSSYNVLQYLNMCYPFFDDAFLLQKIQSHVQESKLTTDKTSESCVYELCHKLYNSALQESSDIAKEALENLLRYMPFNVTLVVTSKLQCTRKYMTTRESDLQDILYTIMNIRIQNQLRDIKKKNDTEKLKSVWIDVSCTLRGEHFLPKFEEALIHTIEFYPSSATTDLVGTVIEFVEKFNFFREDEIKKKILDIMIDSQNHAVLDLFVKLAKVQAMADQFSSLKPERFHTFCLRYISDKSVVLAKREEKFNNFAERICILSCLPVVKQKNEFDKIVLEVWQKELENYQARKLVDHVKCVDEMAQIHKSLGVVFIEHFRSIIEEQEERPQDLMDCLPQCNGQVIIDTKLMADLICTLLNSVDELSEKSSHFDTFLKLVSQCKFWLPIFHSTGRFKRQVQKNDNYIRAESCIINMVKLFKDHEVHYGFVHKLENERQTTLSAKTLLELHCDKNEVDQYWSEALVRFKEVKQELCVVYKVMKQVNQMSPKLPEGFSAVLDHIEDYENRMTSGMVKASECEKGKSVWKDLGSLPDICHLLKDVTKSSVFWNVSFDDVYKEYLRKAEQVEMEKTDEPLSSLCALFQEMAFEEKTCASGDSNCLLFMDTLQKLGPIRYGDKWKQLLTNDDFRIEEVLKMFGTSPDIDTEVHIAKIYLHIVIDSESEEYLKRIFSSDTIRSTVDAMEKVVKVFGLNLEKDEAFAAAIASFRKLIEGAAEEYTFSDVKKALTTVFSLVQNLSEDTVNILIALGQATTLVTFLKTIVDEDIKNLIDAVEDISEQQVREATVSALIEVKQYLHPVLVKSEKTCEEFLQTLEKQTKSSSASSSFIPQKIEDCIQNLHNLKSLYNGVANRGEQTKEMIRNIIHKGSYHFYLNKTKSETTFEASYKQNKTKESRKRSTLIDLRSRALLLMNTEQKSVNEARFSGDDLMNFARDINLCLDIADILFALHSSGHVGYIIVKEAVKSHELRHRKQMLNRNLISWLHDVNAERDSHFLMNFIQGNQIHILYRYLEENRGDEIVVQTILKFIHPEMRALCLQERYKAEKSSCKDWSLRQMLHCIGFAIHSSYEGLEMFKRPVKSQTIKSLSSVVQPNRITVANLDEESLHTVKIVLALYMNTTQMLPEPYNILFCTRETTWTELDLLIRRCLGANEFYGTNVLFCIANVEMLSNEVQFTLVETLRHLPKQKTFLLAVICRGSRNHPFIGELGDCLTSVNPVTDRTVRDIFSEHCENVQTVTSKFPGLGKTSFITTMAHNRQKGVATLHVSGSVRKSYLVDRINMLNLKKYQVLHIDLGNVNNPSELDTFLFELVVLRYITAGNASVSLQTSDVNIEIANTINDTLRNALQTAVLFHRVNLDWSGIEDLIVSSEVNSPVQVVCRYLLCLENKSLDRKDLTFDVESQIPLPDKQCKVLLRKFLSEKLESSFPILFAFINVLADQLKKMSYSSFFKVNRLIDMIGNKTELTVKRNLVEAMIEVSGDFATRSVEVCRKSQASTVVTEEGYTTDHITTVIKRLDSMIRWEDSNHLMFVFHNQNINTLSALYRHLSKVPSEIRNLFESQMKKKMEDFSKMDQENLQNILQRIARINPFPLEKGYIAALCKDYALTADNLLKMVLIMLRIKASIPVVIMGETGCGKTSLIRFLAGICEVEFEVMNIHAGVTEEDIIECVLSNSDKALLNLNEERWLFLDEINTSESVGLISDVICHHQCLGKELPPNLVVMGACNPYKLRSTKAIATAGLEGKAKSDELSRLVYRVLPLPEMMVDYVWDFGSLNEKDEETYIYRMIADVFPENGKQHRLFACLLAVSQSFVRRSYDSPYSVSLRDVQRCKILAKWFLSILPEKMLNINAKSSTCDIDIKSMILSLAHCYQSRFSDKSLRKEYRNVLGDIFNMHGHPFPDGQEMFIQTVIKEEQSDFLRRMKLPPGTAQNTALQENVFVILVCIFNRIPIFVVGKPGCSKSLAMQLIKSNLRGKDSEDDFFKKLPQLYCVSFQGSESSTSDGIIKVFAKAEKYQESNDKNEVLSVVILDEIGLAEVSRFNPLKVLHNLLEPDGKCQPNVAVVGISNWALDASKMNRAVHLSRTDMDEHELYETAVSISESFLGRENKQTLFQRTINIPDVVSPSDIEKELQGMATAYFQYIEQLRFKNFHGLRDYYSLIKFVAQQFASIGHECPEESKAKIIADGIARNFGGLPDEMQTLYEVFERHMPYAISKDRPLMELITENIKDPIARHLMLITTGESVLGIVEKKLKDIGCDRKEVIFGSQFEEDLTDDYNYRILSRIILCMEEGIVLILKDLESIYGSLYDMLNQNYTIIGKKKNCRVALGPYSNPICHVADSFRCIVLTDEKKLDLADPPFLNRFEKHYLRFYDIIEEKHHNVIQKLEDWIDRLADVSDGCIEKEDMFPIYNKDLTASLVLKCESDSVVQFHAPDIDDTILAQCKQKLLWIIKPEVIIRQKMSRHSSIKAYSDELIREYFSLPLHNGFEEFVVQQIDDCLSEDTNGMLTVLFTNSNVHTKVVMTSRSFQCQVEKLGAFKSEKQLSSRIQLFWETDETNILIVQCNAKDDEKHILLTKLVIEKYRNKYISVGNSDPKQVFLIIHLDRSKASSHRVHQLNFLSDWKLVMMDSLECPAVPLPTLCRMTLKDVILEKRPLHKYIQEELYWAFSRIRYGKYGRDVSSISKAVSKIEKSLELLELLDSEIFSCIQRQISGKHDKYWQLEVARDITALASSASFIDALEKFIMSKIKAPLAKLIYLIEQNGILESFFIGQSFVEKWKAKTAVWITTVHEERVFSIDDVPDETGPECYSCEIPAFALNMPFSKYLYECIETTKDDFMETVKLFRLQCFLNEDEELPDEVYEEILLQQEQFLLKKIPDLKQFTYNTWEDDYFLDFCIITAQKIFGSAVRADGADFTKAILETLEVSVHDDPFDFVIRLHTRLWVNFETVTAQVILIDRCVSVIPESKNEIFRVLSDFKRRIEEGSVSESFLEEKRSLELHEPVHDIASRTDLIAVLSGQEELLAMSDKVNKRSDNLSSGSNVSDKFVLRENIDKCSEPFKTLSLDEDIANNGGDSLSEKNNAKSLFRSAVVDEMKIHEITNVDQTLQKFDSSMQIPQFDENTLDLKYYPVPTGESEINEIRTKQYSLISSEVVFEAIERENSDSSVDEKDVKNDNCNMASLPDLLVFTVCKAMLPTTECLEKHVGTKHWLNEVNSTVSLAAQVSRSPRLLYSLRVCIELAAGLIIPLHLSQQYLESIGNAMSGGSALDTKHVFNAIENLIQITLSVAVDKCPIDVNKHCQSVLSSYFVRCISADPETKAYQFLFKLLQESRIPDDYMILFKVPISMLLQTVDRDLFTDIVSTNFLCEFEKNQECNANIETSMSLDDSEAQLLYGFDTCLKYILENERNDDPFLIMLGDLLEDIYMDIFFPSAVRQNENMNTGNTENCISQESVEFLYICHKAVKEYKPGLKYICSVAFCNAFVNKVAEQLTVVNSDISNSLMSSLDIVLSDLPGEKIHFLTVHFLKERLNTTTVRQLLKVGVTFEEKFNFFRDMKLKDRALVTYFEKSPLCVHVEEGVHNTDCFQWKDIDIDGCKCRIENMVENSRRGPDGMIQFLAVVIRDFYLQLVETDIDDARRTLGILVLNEVVGSKLSSEIKNFTKCILGEKDFLTEDFLLTDASSVEQVCKASTLTCFFTLQLAHYEFISTYSDCQPMLIRCLLNPERIKSCFVPGFLTVCAEPSPSERTFGTSIGICTCGQRMAFNDSRHQSLCFVCEKYVKTTFIRQEDETGIPLDTKYEFDIEKEQVSKHLNPVTSHILQFLVKGCLLGSMALGVSTDMSFEEVLRIKENDVEQCLSNGVAQHWEALKELLNLNDNYLAVLMHVIFLKAKHILFCEASTLKTQKEALKWEQNFEREVSFVLETRFSSMRSLLQQYDSIHNEHQNSFEQCLLETNDHTSMTAEDMLIHLPALHRVKARPNKTNFSFELQTCRNEFPLLAKVLEYEEDLQLPKHILNLVQWHTATVANASYMLKSHDCSTMTVQDFIYFKHDSRKKDVMKVRFETFRKSWNEIRAKLRKTEIVAMMKRIHSESRLTDCLILNKESAPFKVLEALVCIQNYFLDQVLLLAGKCDALKLLGRNGVFTLRCVNIMALKKEDLIRYDVDWDSLLAQESHCNLAYGYGRLIEYDFSSIEQAVALEVVSGKSYIVFESLPQVIFIDELHKNYTSLIKDIRDSTSQQLLTPEISNGIKSRRDEDPRMSTELLTHLGIIMTLLKKTGGDPDQSLVDYIDKWKSSLCRYFPKHLLPSPENCIKLCHVVALSELLEEISADAVKEGLGDEYREKLDGPVYDQLMIQLSDEILSSVLLKAVKRFTYRCLASKIADSKQSLRQYLSDESFWPFDSLKHGSLLVGGNCLNLTDILPDGLMVQHIFDCYELIETEIERRRQGNLKLSGFAASFQAKAKATPASRTTQKKKRIVTQRKF